MAEQLEESLTIRFPPSEMAEIERVAAEESRQRGPMIRLLVREALSARAQGRTPDRPLLRPAQETGT